ncbi:14424_t:CDS:2, partial [Cetraspora pellucida]
MSASNKRRNISDSNIPNSDISDSNIPDSNISDFNESSDEEEIVHLDLSGKISWVWTFFRQELRKKKGKWTKYSICKIEVSNDKECGRKYKAGSSTGNLINHLSAEHGITKIDQIPKMNAGETAKYLVNCISDCRTRWNSSYLAWIRLVQIKVYIELLIIYLTSHDNSDDRKDGKRLREINLTNSEWELIKELLQVLGPFEEATRYLGGSYYATHSLMHRVVRELKNIFKSNQVNEDESYNIEDHDAFDDYEEEESQNEQSRIKLNKPVNTTGLLEKVKHNLYKKLCYYYPNLTPQESVSALLDPRLKSLDYMDNMDRIAVKNFLRQLYDNEKSVEIDQNEKELDNNNQNLEKQVSDEFMVTANPLYIPYLLKSLEKEDCPIDDEIDEYMRQPEI